MSSSRKASWASSPGLGCLICMAVGLTSLARGGKDGQNPRKATTRRGMRLFTLLAVGLALISGPAAAQPDPRLIEDLVVANRVLADLGVLDGFGHVSVRHDKDPSRFRMSRSMAPALVKAEDILEYDLDSNAIDAKGRALFLERFIHGEIYKARPDIKAV